MTIQNHIESRLREFGVDCSVVGDEIHVSGPERPTRIKVDEGWVEAFKQYKQARSLSYEAGTRVLTHNSAVEFQLIELGPVPEEQHHLIDLKGNSVLVGPASKVFSLAFFDSSDYEIFFKAVLEKRLTRISQRRFSSMFWIPATATYTAKGRKIPPDLKGTGLRTIKSCLLKLAVEEHLCFTVWAPKTRRLKWSLFQVRSEDHNIPRAVYDENVVSYYKVAKASPFPSQSFLAYYHVLEYHFLRVTEDLLHHRLTSMLNDPRFRTGRENLDKIISAVRGQDSRSDEIEMLRNVLHQYVHEGDLIEFISRIEDSCGEKIYSKKRKVFGELIEINLREGHAMSNAAAVLKLVRNAIVHSSDRYKREECHVPLSDSENVIEEFIPLVRFLAEKVIYGTAQ